MNLPQGVRGCITPPPPSCHTPDYSQRWAKTAPCPSPVHTCVGRNWQEGNSSKRSQSHTASPAGHCSASPASPQAEISTRDADPFSKPIGPALDDGRGPCWPPGTAAQPPVLLGGCWTAADPFPCTLPAGQTGDQLEKGPVLQGVLAWHVPACPRSQLSPSISEAWLSGNQAGAETGQIRQGRPWWRGRCECRRTNHSHV